MSIMFDYKSILGILAVVVAYVGYAGYLRDILKGITKPHAFSWLLWGTLTGIGFAAQVVKGAGAGSWVTGADAFACFLFVFLALKDGDRHFVPFDWVCLSGALFSLVLWWVTSDPTLSVIMITVVDVFAYAPTFRKGYLRPDEETALTYGLSSFKFIVSFFALQSLSIATALYPVYLIVANGIFTLMLLVRRRILRNR